MGTYTGRSGSMVVELAKLMAALAWGYYSDLLTGTATGVYTSCTGVKLADGPSGRMVATTTTLNVTACMACAGATDNIVNATLDPLARYMWIPDALVYITFFMVFTSFVQGFCSYLTVFY